MEEKDKKIKHLQDLLDNALLEYDRLLEMKEKAIKIIKESKKRRMYFDSRDSAYEYIACNVDELLKILGDDE